jgi:hypothetical protein
MTLHDIDDIAEQCGNDSRDWFPNFADNTTLYALAAAGEVGELCNVIKKVERGTHTYEEVSGQIVSEAMDAVIYLLCLLDYEGQDVAALYDKFRSQNVARFGKVPEATPGS